MLTLLSPAKTLDLSPVERRLPATEPFFENDIQVLMKRCKQLSPRSLRSAMSLSEALAKLNHQRFQDMGWPFTPDNAKQCVLAFQGDVYRGLDAESLGIRDLEWAQNHLRVISGLYGLLRPLDLIQPYRLEMGTHLSNTRGKNLYAFWKNRLADKINQEHAQKPISAIVNLASIEYFKAVPRSRLEPRVIDVAFKEIREGKPRVISFFAKRARGLMARYIIKNRIDEPEQMKEFAEEGYSFRPELSEEDVWVFARESS